jgi:hypothetical protein
VTSGLAQETSVTGAGSSMVLEIQGRGRALVSVDAAEYPQGLLEQRTHCVQGHVPLSQVGAESDEKAPHVSHYRTVYNIC